MSSIESLLELHYSLAENLRDLEHEDESRKALIRLCVVRAHTFQPRSQGLITSAEQTASSVPTSESQEIQRKLRDYELRISVLKLQLSTKEMAHEAQVDELKEVVKNLRGQIRTSSAAKIVSAGRSIEKPRLASPPSSTGAARESAIANRSIFSVVSPSFSMLLKGKGNSFADSGLDSIASQATLKLSQKAAVFSANSSSESTPSRNRTDEPFSGKLAKSGPDASGSDNDDTFQSANTTFSDSSQKKRKRKVQLLSTEASKLILDLQGKGLHVEDENLNSLNYYQDDNFLDDTALPVRALERPSEAAQGPPSKKRHVFKI